MSGELAYCQLSTKKTKQNKNKVRVTYNAAACHTAVFYFLFFILKFIARWIAVM